MFSPPQLENSSPGVDLLSLPTLTSTPTHHPDCCLSLSTTLLHFLSSLFLSLHSSSPSPSPTTTATAAATPQSVLTVFSIGSGTGLLEALLTRHLVDYSGRPPGQQRTNLVGVEVYASPPVNKYLDDDHVCLVRGTWDVCETATTTTAAASAAAAAAAVWMFVYPRHVSLVEKYTETLQLGLEEEREEGARGVGRGRGKALQMVIWAGPRADVVDYEGVFGKLQAGGWVREEQGKEGEVVVGVAEWDAVVVLRRG